MHVFQSSNIRVEKPFYQNEIYPEKSLGEVGEWNNFNQFQVVSHKKEQLLIVDYIYFIKIGGIWFENF